ncbi:zinc finger MYM-type protein 1-like, partial [Aphis craccivora]
IFPNDIANFCRKQLNNIEKYEVLVHNWIPDINFKFPTSEDGAYCRYCVSFGSNSVGKGGHQNTNLLVETAFQDLIKLENTKKKKYITLTPWRMEKILIVLLCGRQGLSLRGHRDQSYLSLKMPVENDGNFRALFRYALDSGDQGLTNHLNTVSANSTYLSFCIQNEIIDAAGILIKSNIVGIEQFSIWARFVDKTEEYKIREDFLCFIPVENVTGKRLVNTLLITMENIGINLVNMRGQGYDGARAMSGQFNGCAAKVRELYPQAIYFHCANHNLNLAITHACKISSIRNCIGKIKEVVNLFRLSNKAGLVLKEKIQASCPSTKQTCLLKFCETRWVENLDSLSLFNDVYEHICLLLEYLDENNLKTIGVKPHALLASIQTPQFIIALTVVKPIFNIIKNLSVFLQKEDCDLVLCIDYVNNQQKKMADKMDINLAPPRNVGIQKNRDNYEGGPEEYFRRFIFLPFLDHLLMQLKIRFLEYRELLSKIQNILPTMCSELNTKKISETVNAFAKEWLNNIKGSTDDFIAEMTIHCLNISKDKRPKTFIETLNNCNSVLYPSIHTFLQIGATLPVSVATSERSFSCLRRLKTYLRNKTGGRSD